jgi:hypothetical protein
MKDLFSATNPMTVTREVDLPRWRSYRSLEVTFVEVEQWLKRLRFENVIRWR